MQVQYSIIHPPFSSDLMPLHTLVALKTGEERNVSEILQNNLHIRVIRTNTKAREQNCKIVSGAKSSPSIGLLIRREHPKHKLAKQKSEGKIINGAWREKW